jgi:glycosyltransferase involved in cell wall biosynthesis
LARRRSAHVLGMAATGSTRPAPPPIEALRRPACINRPPAPTLRPRARPLRVAMLAPPWIPIPPPKYGGIEVVVSHLVRGLVARGVEVTLLAAPGSRAPGAEVVALLDTPAPERIGDAFVEVDHVARAFALVDRAAAEGRPFDVVHDHCGCAAFAMADRLRTPLLHTLHGPFDEATSPFYAAHASKAWVVPISRWQLRHAPPGVRSVGVIPNPIDVEAWPLQARKGDHLLWMGRMTEYKGAHRAIAVAQRSGRPLVLAGPVQPGQEEYFARAVEPHVDGSTIRYVGEVGGADKQRLFAEAAALLMPIRWAEPFGMVMIEAMAVGTPVIAFREGAACEVIGDGGCGFLVDDEDEMVAAVGRLPEIDPAACRQHVKDAYDVAVVARAYEEAYRQVRAARAGTMQASW